jgi:hypothetical protein
MEGNGSNLLEDPPVTSVHMMHCTVRKTGGPTVIPSAARNLALLGMKVSAETAGERFG